MGELPRGWQRRPDTLVWSFSVEGIPHAYVHLVCGRIEGDTDVAAQIEKRESNYRFPGEPAGTQGTLARTEWAGRPALRYEREAKVRGVLCRRRVTVLFLRPFWYERIETIYGARTGELDACRRGLEIFRRGFRLLVEPLPDGAARETGAQEIRNDELGYRISKPAGFLRAAVDPARDPGCRVAFAAAAGDPRGTMRVRLFEYGTRARLDAAKWMGIFFADFSRLHRQARRTETAAGEIRGAVEVLAELFTGERDGRPVRTLLLLLRSKSDRVLLLRIRTTPGDETGFAGVIEKILGSLKVD